MKAHFRNSKTLLVEITMPSLCCDPLCFAEHGNIPVCPDTTCTLATASLNTGPTFVDNTEMIYKIELE